MNVHLVYNPLSGRRQAPRTVAWAEAHCRAHGISLRVHRIEGPGHGTILAGQAVEAGAERVICSGGDGTLNAVARGLLGTTVPLGVVPDGSGNGYSRSLGIPRDPRSAFLTALNGQPRPMDVCYLDDLLFLGTAGIGFDARVAHAFDRSSTRGFWKYFAIILREIFQAGTIHVRVQAGGREVEENVLMVVFANTREFGNGARIAPAARPDDGLADIKLVRKPGTFGLFKAFLDLYTGNADRSPYITTILANEAFVEHDSSLAHVDGEPVHVNRKLRFSLERGALEVICP
ncbi:MAG: diacylglycerol kinase family lipid kinase [Flavobacteriales bacterium]|nr:diacylglycerol kinase family lipid kinase [Flavobacteriales bacterium]